MHSFVGGFTLMLALSAPLGDPGTLAPQAGVVILKNGHVIKGEITRAGDYLIVTQGAQSELRLQNSQVEFVSATLEEAYEKKALAVSTIKADPHLDLAEWCLRQDLPAKAAEQIAAAIEIDSKNGRIASLEQRLKLHLEHPAKARASRHESPAMSPEELDKFTRDQPKVAVEKFAATIQPILLNRCASGGCHGPTSTSDFKLFRPAAGLVANRRFTQRNLYAALEQIQRENPERSPLLLKPQERHGVTGAPVFDKQSQNQLEQLAAWVQQAVTPERTLQPASIRPGAEQLSQPARNTLSDSTDVEQKAEPSHLKDRPSSTPKREEKPRSDANREYAPRDPFDAEQFNRLYHQP